MKNWRIYLSKSLGEYLARSGGQIALGSVGLAAIGTVGFAVNKFNFGAKGDTDFWARMQSQGAPAGIMAGTLMAAFLLRKPMGSAFLKATKGTGPRPYLNGMMKLGAGAIRGVGDLVGGTEKHFVRPLLTGKGGHISMVDAYLPNFRKYTGLNPERIGLNPRVGAMLMAGGVVAGVGTAAHEAVTVPSAPPTVFYDGVNMRHRRDQGVTADYGRAILGKNSAFHTQPLM